MTGFPDRETIRRIRKEYPAGTKIKLLRMDDPQAPPPGTMGTVTGVDDAGNLLISWDNGSSLHVIYDEDKVCKT